MNCKEAHHLIHGYLDGELDLAASLQVEEHLKNCPACACTCDEFKALRAAILRSAPYFEAPRGLASQIQTRIRRDVFDQTPSLRWQWLWQSLRVPLATAAVVLVCLAPFVFRQRAADTLTVEIVSAHVRSLMLNHLTDVASTDQHTVKPWFNGKLDFSPPVKDLAPQGFALVGGRLDYLQAHPVAALVYQRRQHLINLFLWPTTKSGDSAEKAYSARGYHLLAWTQDNTTCWAVSDLNLKELEEFTRLVRGPGRSR